MESFTTVIIVTILSFAALAAVLLVPVYLFLKKEEQIAEMWTREALLNEEEGSTSADTAPYPATDSNADPTSSS